MKLAAGIVLYNPNINILKQSIKELEQIVSSIILVDNNSNNIYDIAKISSKKILLIKNKKNRGIAEALNQILEIANNEKCDYLLTLDQDSILEEIMIKKMLPFLEKRNVAIVCPRIIDINRDNQKKFNGEYEEVYRCITSGSVMNLKLCNKIGFFIK